MAQAEYHVPEEEVLEAMPSSQVVENFVDTLRVKGDDGNSDEYWKGVTAGIGALLRPDQGPLSVPQEGLATVHAYGREITKQLVDVYNLYADDLFVGPR